VVWCVMLQRKTGSRCLSTACAGIPTAAPAAAALGCAMYAHGHTHAMQQHQQAPVAAAGTHACSHFDRGDGYMAEGGGSTLAVHWQYTGSTLAVHWQDGPVYGVTSPPARGVHQRLMESISRPQQHLRVWGLGHTSRHRQVCRVGSSSQSTRCLLPGAALRNQHAAARCACAA
jgi:hypothetical protein